MKRRKALLSGEELLVRDKVNKASKRVSEKCEQTLHMQARTEPNTYDKHKHLSYSLRQGFCLSLLFIHLLTHCAVDDFPQQIGISSCVPSHRKLISQRHSVDFIRSLRLWTSASWSLLLTLEMSSSMVCSLHANDMSNGAALFYVLYLF